MLEKVIEERVCKYAETKGLMQYKFTSPQRRSVPDRLFFLKGGRSFLIEFKREGQKPTLQQDREHKRLLAHEVPVFVVDNVDEGKRIIDLMCNEVPSWLR